MKPSLLIIYLIIINKSKSSSNMNMRVGVLVLGDIGRSPRMQYHAHSLAHSTLLYDSSSSCSSSSSCNNSPSSSSSYSDFIKVSLVGYDGESPLESLSNRPNVDICRIRPLQFAFLSHVKPIQYIMKGIGLVFIIMYNIIKLGNVNVILVQNPPCIPVLLAIMLVNIIRFILLQSSIKIVIDWHNLGFSMFSINLGEKHWLVRVSFAIEKLLSGLGSSHLCVSHEMKTWLIDNFKLKPDSIRVFYDRPFRKVAALRGGHYDQFVNSNSDGSSNSSYKISRRNAKSGDDVPSSSSSSNNTTVVTLTDRHNLFMKLNLVDEALFPNIHVRDSSDSSQSSGIHKFLTIQTEVINSNSNGKNKGRNNNSNSNSNSDAIMRDNSRGRCFIAMTATSWTEDENFDLLVEAMLLVDKHLRSSNQSRNHQNQRHNTDTPSRSKSPLSTSHSTQSTPTVIKATKATTVTTETVKANNSQSQSSDRLLVIVTGKGPLKAFYEDKFKQLQASGQLQYVSFVTKWLEIADYPKLISCCDVGISLHTSTSGIDLPMKVLDMFGAGLPVFAVNFKAIGELVVENKNGHVFDDSSMLSELIVTMIASKGESIEHLRAGASSIQSWEENWNNVVLPLMRTYSH